MTALIALFGGVRGTIAAGVGLVALLAAGAFFGLWQISSSKLDACQAEGRQYADAQKSNLATIEDLSRRYNEVVATHARNEKAAADAAEKLEAEKAKIAKDLAKTRKELSDVYAKSPSARAWGRSGVDRAVADRLPAGTD